MLPSRPSPRNANASAPLSRSVRTSNQEDSYSSEKGLRSEAGSEIPPRQVLSQRSTANIPATRTRSDAPPLPREHMRSSARSKSSRVYDPLTRHDTGSSSSNGTSIMDRIRGGDTSSRSSLEDVYEKPKRGQAREDMSYNQRLRSESENEEPTEVDNAGVGYTLWGRLASAAGVLGVDVSKAWTGKVDVYSGEVTPPEQESRLTQAMKAYHLEKARDPSDLPSWLFEEHERRPIGRSRFASRQNHDSEGNSAATVPATSRSRGLRDVYEAAATAQAPSTTTSYGRADREASSRIPGEPAPVASKAANRLQAMRDARRQNSGSVGIDGTPSSVDTNQWDRTEKESVRVDTDTSGTTQLSRVGLPAGPGARARRF